MIYTVTLNPSLDKTLLFPGVARGELNRACEVRLDLGGKRLNASRALLSLGLGSTAAGFVAGSTGAYLQHGLETLGICTDFIQIDEGETRAKITYDVKPNAQEPSEALGRPLCSEEDMRLAAEEFLDVGIQLVALSRGAAGVLVGSLEGIIKAMPLCL